jgi:hypothetical protein
VPGLVIFTTRLPSDLAGDLARAGYNIFEALAISEVLHLCETEKIDLVIVDSAVEEHRARVVQQHYPTLRLTPGTTTYEVIAELWQMLPERTSGIQ